MTRPARCAASPFSRAERRSTVGGEPRPLNRIASATFASSDRTLDAAQYEHNESAPPPKADAKRTSCIGCFGPIPDPCSAAGYCDVALEQVKAAAILQKPVQEELLIASLRQ
jgi:hypothetical protein